MEERNNSNKIIEKQLMKMSIWMAIAIIGFFIAKYFINELRYQKAKKANQEYFVNIESDIYQQKDDDLKMEIEEMAIAEEEISDSQDLEIKNIFAQTTNANY